jgi:DNA-binding CsgD family transcriptional regulator
LTSFYTGPYRIGPESFHDASQNGHWMRSIGPIIGDLLLTPDDASEPAAGRTPGPGAAVPAPSPAVHGASAPEAGCPPEPSPELTDEEVAVLRLVAEGLPIDSVAARLGMSPRTVRRRMHDVCENLGVRSTIQAVVWAAHHGLV